MPGVRVFLRLSVLISLFSISSPAAVLSVSTTNDSGPGSLRQAISDAVPGDTIAFSITGTVTLTSGQLQINKNIVIVGSGPASLTISGNGTGRVFYVGATGTADISGLTITGGGGNVGGGLYNIGSLKLSNCVVAGNQTTLADGGISNEGSLAITNTSIVNNSAVSGGGIGNNGTLTVTNSTFSGNTASDYAGSLLNYGAGVTTLTNCTIAANSAVKSAGGVHNWGKLTSRNTIIARNSSAATPDFGGAFFSLGSNLIGNNSGTIVNNKATSDQLNVDPKLAPLTYNGGLTPTHALLPGSPAIDHGSSTSMSTDQRGFPRVSDLPNVANVSGGDGSDVGAVEGVSPDFQSSVRKAGSLLVFPYYTSRLGSASDTRISIANAGSVNGGPALSATIHLYFIDGTNGAQSEQFVCLAPNRSLTLKTSEYDPEITGWLLVLAVDANGNPFQNNVLTGSAYLTDGDYCGSYGPETFAANTQAIASSNGNGTASLFLNGSGYDAAPSQFTFEFQSPLDAAGQKLVLAGLGGDLSLSKLTGTGQIGTGQVTNGKDGTTAGFTNFLADRCQVIATLTAASPRVQPNLGTLVPSGGAGSIKVNVGAAVGLLMVPKTSRWNGIRTLTVTGVTNVTLIVPVSKPGC